MTSSVVIWAVGAAILAVIYALGLTYWVIRKPQGNERMREIASYIQEGASAYLNRQYLVIAVIGVVVAVVLFFTLGLTTAILYVVGAVLSAAAGYVGMNVAVRS